INDTVNEPPPPGVPADTPPGPSAAHPPENRQAARMLSSGVPFTRFAQSRFTMLSRLKFVGLAWLVAGLFLYAGIAPAQEKAGKMVEKGEFHNADKAGKGTARIYQLADGKRVLRLTNFSVDNGPDLHVRLIAADDAKNTPSVAKAPRIELC